MERKQPRWEKGQSVLHKDDKKFKIENAYGGLRYAKEDISEGQKREGFAVEAKEAPGTPGHTEKEKHLELTKMKKVKMGGERFLYASGTPFRNQALFYDVERWERGREFLESMKEMLGTFHNSTMENTFGFLEQEPERLQKQMLEQRRRQELTLEEFHDLNGTLDHLNSSLQKKEASERQLCTQLQQMLDQRKEEEQEKEQKKDWKQLIGRPIQKQTVSASDGEAQNEEDTETADSSVIKQRERNPEERKESGEEKERRNTFSEEERKN